MSLFDAADRLAAIDRSQVTLDPDRCLHSLDRFSDCGACYTVCPVDAITPGKPPVYNNEACKSCFACLPICPTGAFQADDAVTPLLNCVSRVEQKTIEVLCEQHHNAEVGSPESGAVRVKGCLAGLGSGAYLMLSAMDLEKIIVRVDACESCPWNALQGQALRQISQARMLLGIWGKEDTLTALFETNNLVERPIWNAANPPLSRRDLFRMIGQQGQITMARAMENQTKTTGKNPGKDRRRINAAVSHLPNSYVKQSITLKNFGFANIAISAKCTACGACAQACPTQAIKLEHSDDDTEFTLRMVPSACIACGICARVCLPEAIDLDLNPVFGDIFADDTPKLLHSGKLTRCKRCKSFMAEREGSELCSLCEERKNNPFGSKLPPSIKIRTPNPIGNKNNDH